MLIASSECVHVVSPPLPGHLSFSYLTKPGLAQCNYFALQFLLALAVLYLSYEVYSMNKVYGKRELTIGEVTIDPIQKQL